MAPLEDDADAANTGLSRGIGIRKLIIEPSLANPGKFAKRLEMARTSFQPVEAESGATIQYGHLDGKPGTWYMVEYRVYGDSVDTAGQEKIIQLAGLLNTGPDADAQLKICRCEGYFHDAAQSRIGLISQLPVSAEANPSGIASLSSLLTKKGLRPGLLSRVRLALALVRTVRRLHMYGWLHKSLRSENAIFPAACEPQAEGVSTDVGLEDPRIVGFEYSRRESDFSSVRHQHDHAQNLYRHPARWGVPTERFGKIHDLYSLGVMLLEIGLWERVKDIDRGALLAPEMANQPETVRQRLVKHATRRLEFYMGTKYADFAVFCLSVERPANDAEEQSIMEKVSRGVEYLESISESI